MLPLKFHQSASFLIFSCQNIFVEKSETTSGGKVFCINIKTITIKRKLLCIYNSSNVIIIYNFYYLLYRIYQGNRFTFAQSFYFFL